ncbi:MAG TPA: hypothetical protein VKV35_07445 [Streptosporangiaceae bacterium]|nr:hypothetical protein [Streptosporangiaceae bacterium]
MDSPIVTVPLPPLAGAADPELELHAADPVPTAAASVAAATILAGLIAHLVSLCVGLMAAE